MKIKSLLIGASALGFAAAAQAQTTVINITGATAFRNAAHAAIMASFNQAGVLGTTWNYAWNGSSASGANNQIYKGAFPGITGTTVIRTSWTGSVEGVRALTKPTLVAESYLKDSVSNLVTGSSGGVKAGASEFETSNSHQFAFADMAQAAAPVGYASPKLNGGPVGVIAFLPVINEGADASITNITINQFRRLVSNGTIPGKMLTGNASSNGTIYNVQRNDGSGTRVIHLAEIGHGQANLTKGYVFGNLSLTSTPVLAPATGDLSVYGISSGQNRVRFSNDFSKNSVLGNGGYVSGSSIASLMGQTSTGYNIISWLGTGDAKTSVTGGGRVLAYNGEKLEGVAGGTDLSADDINKIALGKYSAWSFENLFYVGTLSGPRKAVYDRLVANMPNSLGAAGVSMATMKVVRATDGGVIAPKP